jgi:hypothetical protein
MTAAINKSKNFEILPFESRGFSSTQVRKSINDILDGNAQASILQDTVHRKVFDYILENKLFSLL